MKYLAFDIEAANGYKPSSICSIGIVIADERFEILTSRNIWINPKTAYNLNGTRRNVGIDLHLDKKLLDSSPDFSQVYDEIKKYLTDKEYVVLGHAADADARMLNAACSRYKLPCIEFEFIDSQLLYKLYKGDKDVKALNKIGAEIGVEFCQHNSREDAYATMQTLRYLAQDSGLTVDELLSKYRIRKGVNSNFEISRCVTLDGQVSKRRLTQVAVDKIKKYAQTVKVISREYDGMTFSIARSLELSNGDKLYAVVKSIVERGGRYVGKLVKCNAYVVNDVTTEQDVMREKRVAELQAQGLVVVVTADAVIRGEKFLFGGVNMTAKEFLALHGQDAARVDLRSCVEKFIADMAKGLRGEGGMPMIPTYLTDIDRSKIRKGEKTILIDAGGTNFRVALGSFDADGKAVITDVEKSVMPASQGEKLTKQEFYDAIARNVKDYLSKARDVGFCFSYQVDMDRDVDGTIVMFSKEIDAPEVVGTRVGAETLAACRKYDDAERRIVVLNDTVATLLGGMAISDKRYSAYLGYIYGTGTNLCYIEDTSNITKVKDLPRGKMLVNTECGNFEGFFRGEFDETCIRATAVPSKQLFEKTASGKYLADVMAEAFAVARREKRFADDVTLAPFELKDVSSFLSGGAFPCVFKSAADENFAREICAESVDRAARMGAVINAAAAIVSCKEKSLPVAVVAEGTTFDKLTGYRAAFEKYLTEILSPRGITYEIIQGEDLNLVGSLMAAMSLR